MNCLRTAARTAASSSLRARAGAKRSVAIEAKLAGMGAKLPAVGAPKGSYVLWTRSGDLLFTAGHLPQPADGPLVTGKVGQDLTAEEGAEAASLAFYSLMSTLKAELGDLDRIEKFVKVVAFVNCVDGFGAQPTVVNGFSDLVGEVFGPEVGSHARSAVGTNALPLNVPVEIECIVRVKD